VAIVGIVEELGLFRMVYAKMEVCNAFGVWFGGRKPNVKVGSLEVHRNFSKIIGRVDQCMVVDARLKSFRKQRVPS
jgi:hypothetical protein